MACSGLGTLNEGIGGMVPEQSTSFSEKLAIRVSIEAIDGRVVAGNTLIPLMVNHKP